MQNISGNSITIDNPSRSHINNNNEVTNNKRRTRRGPKRSNQSARNITQENNSHTSRQAINISNLSSPLNTDRRATQGRPPVIFPGDSSDTESISSRSSYFSTISNSSDLQEPRSSSSLHNPNESPSNSTSSSSLPNLGQGTATQDLFETTREPLTRSRSLTQENIKFSNPDTMEDTPITSASNNNLNIHKELIFETTREPLTRSRSLPQENIKFSNPDTMEDTPVSSKDTSASKNNLNIHEPMISIREIVDAKKLIEDIIFKHPSGKKAKEFLKNIIINAKNAKDDVVKRNSLLKRVTKNIKNKSIVKTSEAMGNIACETYIDPFILLPKKISSNPNVKKIEKEYKEEIQKTFSINKEYRKKQVKALGIAAAKGVLGAGLATAITSSFGALIGFLTAKKSQEVFHHDQPTENTVYPELDIDNPNFNDLEKIDPKLAEALESNFSIFCDSTEYGKEEKEQMIKDFKETYNKLPAESREAFVNNFQAEFSVNLSNTLNDINNITTDTDKIHIDTDKAEEIINKTIQSSQDYIANNFNSTKVSDFVNPVTIGEKTGAAYGAIVGSIIGGGLLAGLVIKQQKNIKNPVKINVKEGQKESIELKAINEAKEFRVKAKAAKRKVNILFNKSVKPALESTFHPSESNKVITE